MSDSRFSESQICFFYALPHPLPDLTEVKYNTYAHNVAKNW